MEPTPKTRNLFSFIEIMARSPVLQDFVSKSEKLTQLNRLVLKKLDPTLATQCRVTAFKNNILSITAVSPAFGHKLHFLSADLLSTLRQDPALMALKAIETKVQPDPPTSLDLNESALPRPRLNAKAAQCLQSIAQASASPKLKQSLLRLSKRYVAVAGYK